MGNKMNNAKKVFKNKKPRLNLIIGVSTVFILLIAGFYFLTSNNNKANSPNNKKGANISKQSKNYKEEPGTSKSKDYNNLVKKNNEKKTKKAIKNNSSYIPTLTSSSTGKGFDGKPKSSKKQKNRNKKSKPQMVYVLMPNHKNSKINNKKREKEIKQRNKRYKKKAQKIQSENKQIKKKEQKMISHYQSNYTKVMNNYLNPNSKTTQEVAVSGGAPVFSYEQNNQKSNNNSSNNSSKNNNNNNHSNNITSGQSNKKVLASAGSVLPAVTMKGVDTDYSLPVMAKIVGGKFNNAVAIGKVKLVYSKAVLAFNKLSLPNNQGTINITGYAVNTNTQQYGLAGNVNHHILHNIAAVAGAAFIQGLGQAASRGRTTTSLNSGGAYAIRQKLSSGRLLLSSLGRVGQRLSRQLAQSGRRPTTVKIPSGKSIGIMLTKNVTAQ